MEQRERDKKSRQILSQQFVCQDTPDDHQPLFSAPIRVTQSDDRLQRQLGSFELVNHHELDKYIGVQGPTLLRVPMPMLGPQAPLASAYAHANPTGAGGGYTNSGGGGIYSNSRTAAGMNINKNHSMGNSGSSSSSAGFLKPKDAPPNGMSRYGSSQQQQQPHPAHNRAGMHDVSGQVWVVEPWEKEVVQ